MVNSSQTTPSTEQIFRYIDSMTRDVRSVMRDKMVPSLSTIQGIHNTLVNLLHFRHEELSSSYGEHEQKRIRMHLDQLVQKGLLHQGTWHKPAWIGIVVFKKIAMVWMKQALQDGCRSWDVHMHMLLGAALQYALAARAGDIARSKGYKEWECLLWKHVTLTLKVSTATTLTANNVQAHFLLPYTKGHK